MCRLLELGGQERAAVHPQLLYEAHEVLGVLGFEAEKVPDLVLAAAALLGGAALDLGALANTAHSASDPSHCYCCADGCSC